MLKVKTILPVVLVSCVAILALAFMLTYFAHEQAVGYASSSFQLNPVLNKQWYQNNGPVARNVQQLCTFNSPPGKAFADPDLFCSKMLGVDARGSGAMNAITCFPPCGVYVTCPGDDSSVKPCQSARQ